jgi:hypothetical protein
MDKYIDELYKLDFTCESPVSFVLKVNGEREMFVETNTRFNSLWVRMSQGQYRMIKKVEKIEDLIPFIKNEVRALKIRNL